MSETKQDAFCERCQETHEPYWACENGSQAFTRQQLKDAVVEAAKAARAAETRRNGEGDESLARLIAAEKALRRAVSDLLEFESQDAKES